MEMATGKHKGIADLEVTLDFIRQSPEREGQIELIVCRPAVGERQVLQVAALSPERGLVGDNWQTRSSKRPSANPDMQLTLMNARAIGAIAGDKSLWPMAGDQLYVDLDLSDRNLPPGTRLQVGEAIIEVTAEPHLGCRKFSDRYGKDAVKFVNSDLGKRLNLRGINAKVISPGSVSSGAPITKL